MDCRLAFQKSLILFTISGGHNATGACTTIDSQNGARVHLKRVWI
jgi:hypothetical protein